MPLIDWENINAKMCINTSAEGNTKVALSGVKEEFEAMGIEVKTTKKSEVIGVFKGEYNKNQKIVCAHIDSMKIQ